MTADAPPLVSVLVPCWNAEASIERALTSVLEERAVPLECVVVDDGSTDGTTMVVQAVAARDPRVRLLRSLANEGVSNARNRGLEAARGEWLTFLDADDRLLPGAIASLFRAAQETGALVVVGQRVWSDGERTWISSFYDLPDIREPGRKSLANNPGLVYYASATGKLFHRSCTADLRFSGRVLGDQPWTIRALLRAGDRIEVIGDTVYEWTRPGARIVAATITVTTRSSARLGVEAAAVAEEALVAVRAEAGRVLHDPQAQGTVVARYAERLLRSDLGIHLSNALRRGDPDSGLLMAAIARFVTTAPAGLLGASDALARDILEPPLRRWDRVPVNARPNYWALFDTAMRADSSIHRHASNGLAGLALRVARSQGSIARTAATALLLVARVPTAILLRLRARSRTVAQAGERTPVSDSTSP